MNVAFTAALDFPRQQLRAAFIGALIIVGVATAWQVLAETHMAVVLQLSALAIYILAVARSLHASTEIQDILGRGMSALGTACLLCAALIYLHDAFPIEQSVYFFAITGLASAALFAWGLWLARPPMMGGKDELLQALAREWPEFATFHRDNLANSLAEVEQVRRKTLFDYWKLSALGVPAAAGAGLVLIISDLAGRPPGWMFSIIALALLLCAIGTAILRWRPSSVRREEILRELGGHLVLSYHFGGAEDADLRATTIFGAASYAHLLSLLPRYRELKLGAAFRGSQAGQPFVFGEVTTIPPRKLGQNTARMGRHFLLLVLELSETAAGRTVCFEDRGLFGHRGLHPDIGGDEEGADHPAGADRTPGALVRDALGTVLLGPNHGSRTGVDLGLKNTAFESSYNIFAEDLAAARAQLTDDFTETVMAVRQSLPLSEIPRFAFDEGQFVLAIEASAPWLKLDPPGAMAIGDPRYAAAILARLQAVLRIVDSLS
ncbi:MAG: DUF3137 domain-containing protein [Rhodospirillaceae bacterium]|nr:DUF3137 domain-containing protein [Rhodospirillaceae bacterium]